ncbi:MAG: GNAT family N-acetyltransferase, partial [Xenococcus sp. (in: cyanobacteria)]
MIIDIQAIKKLSVVELKSLIEDSQNQGFSFVQFLVDEWLAGTNCFNKKGEVLLVAKDNNQPIGLCGLNIDPYYPVV